jgi:hypothetical protein
MSETLTHGQTLARLFHDEFHDHFQEAVRTEIIKDRYFLLSTKEFDDWLVSHYVIAAPAAEFDSNSLERRGSVMLRNEARRRLNIFALKAEDFPAYIIGPSKNNNLKVRLISLFAQEAPEEIATRVRVSTEHHRRVISGALKTMDRSPDVRSEDRAAMKAFSRFMLPMLEAFSSGMTEALLDTGRRKSRAKKTAAR